MNCPKCGLINTGNMVVGLAMPQCMCQWQSTQEKSGVQTVPAQGTLLPKRKWVNVECPLCGDMAVAETHPVLNKREWVGLTDEERNHARQTVTYSQLAMTADEWTEAVQIETERRLKEKNT